MPDSDALLYVTLEFDQFLGGLLARGWGDHRGTRVMRDDIRWTELSDGLLQAEFPEDLPVHSCVQQFRFDADGLHVGNDYHPEMLSVREQAWAANVVRSPAEFRGIPYSSVRKVGPTRQRLGTNLSLLKMVGIKVENWRLASPALAAQDRPATATSHPRVLQPKRRPVDADNPLECPHRGAVAGRDAAQGQTA